MRGWRLAGGQYAGWRCATGSRLRAVRTPSRSASPSVSAVRTPWFFRCFPVGVAFVRRDARWLRAFLPPPAPLAKRWCANGRRRWRANGRKRGCANGHKRWCANGHGQRALRPNVASSWRNRGGDRWPQALVRQRSRALVRQRSQAWVRQRSQAWVRQRSRRGRSHKIPTLGQRQPTLAPLVRRCVTAIPRPLT